MRLAGVIAIILVSVAGLAVAARGAAPILPGNPPETAAPAADREAPPVAQAPGAAPGSAAEPEHSSTAVDSQTAAGGSPPTAADSPASASGPTAGDQDLLALLSATADKIDAIRDAIRDKDANSLLRFQHELLGDLQRGRELTKQDESREGKTARDALDQVEGGLSGDVTKLEGAARALNQATIALAKARGVTLAPRPDRVSDLRRYAQDAASKVANFQRGYLEGDASRLLRLQRELLQMADAGLASLRSSYSPQAQQVKSALQDIQAALPEDIDRLETARTKLLDVTGTTTQPTAAAKPAAAATAPPAQAQATPKEPPFRDAGDLIAPVNGLGQRVGALRLALQNGNQDDAQKARAALADEVKRTEGRLAGANFAEAERLRKALVLLNKVAGGDDQQVDPASEALSNVVGR